MALFRKFFNRKPPDGLLEISERVYVFDCCFSTDVLDSEDYKIYLGGIVSQLKEHLPDASFMVFNFREGEHQSQIANILSDYDMTVMDYPKHYEGCPLLTMEMIHHFLRSSESWLSLGLHNTLMMHCEQGGWPVLAFMLAALLIYRKQYTGEEKTLEMIYKQAPRELLNFLSPLNPLPSQLRYLQYVSRRNMASEWPPLDRALTLDCIILRNLPNFDGELGCRPIFRIYGQDPFICSDRTPKVLFSTPKRSEVVRHYKQTDCELVKIDIHCHIQGDIVLECISLDEDMEREVMMFRVMFNTAFIRSNILIVNRDEIDILWDSKENFPKDFRAEILLSDMNTSASFNHVEFAADDVKEGLPMEAFSKVQEFFNNIDWLYQRGEAGNQVLQQITSLNLLAGKMDMSSHQKHSTEANTTKQRTHPALECEGVVDARPLTFLSLSLSGLTSSFLESPQPSKHSAQSPLPLTPVNSVSKSSVVSPRNPSGQTYGPSTPSLTNISITTCSQMPSPPHHSSPTLSPLHHSCCRKTLQSPLPLTPVNSVSKSSVVSPRNPSGQTYGPSTPSLTNISITTCSQMPSPPHHSSPTLSPLHHSCCRKTLQLIRESSSSLSSSSSSSSSSPPLPHLSFSFSPAKSSPVPPPPPPPPPSSSRASVALPLPLPSVSNSSSMAPLSPPSPFSLGESTISPLQLSSSSKSLHHPSPISISESMVPPPRLSSSITPMPPPPPPPPPIFISESIVHPPRPSSSIKSMLPPPPPPPISICESTAPLSRPQIFSSRSMTPPPPPPPTSISESRPSSMVPAPPIPPILGLHRSSSSSTQKLPIVPPVPPPPLSSSLPGCPKLSTQRIPPVPSAPTGSFGSTKEHNLMPTSGPGSALYQHSLSRRTSLKPLHWIKVTRVMQGSIWAETQKHDELSKAPDFDMFELESLFSATAPVGDVNSSTEKSRRATAGPKSDKVHLVDLRRANNCEIMLTKVKIPLPDLMTSLLALDDSVLDVDQVDNLIKFCPTKEEIELLKGFNGEKENLGKCEQFFLELMKVPRVESKLRVFSFKIQFCSQVEDLRNNLYTVNSSSDEIRNSTKLKRIMQTILSLGNALNQGTARGSAVGFRLDSLLKLTDTRARNNKTTLMHYLCKVLADKLPELLDFSDDLVSLEAASKVQLKTLAEEMQAVTRGLEKVEQELTASENDGPISHNFCQNLKEFLVTAESDVRTLTSLYTGVGRNADALAFYFGEDPVRCPFEQVVSTLLLFVKMFRRAHEENRRQIELERKKSLKERESGKIKVNARRRDPNQNP